MVVFGILTTASVASLMIGIGFSSYNDSLSHGIQALSWFIFWMI